MGDPWRKNEDDPEMDGEKLKGEVVMMDKDYTRVNWKERSTFRYRRDCASREKNVDEFGFTARCPGCMSLLR